MEAPPKPPTWSAAMLAAVQGVVGDADRLRMLSRMADEADEHRRAVRAARNEAVARLRAEGVAMGDIARWAGVTDSYLSRMVLRNGAPRRVGRRLPR